jgi:[ribosomal protein S18]-alanine N-acetyltransferase
VNFTLRSYKAEDFETLYQIDQECYERDIAYSKRELRAYLSFPRAECVVAETGGEIAGFCISANENRLGYIVTLDVLARFCRQGAGAAILNEVERRLTAHGVREVDLETATDNESAIAFWQKHGYRSRGVRKNYYPGGRDAFAMSKAIAPAAATAKESQ